MPSVSIILCTYNRARYLKDAIESVLSQTFADWELLLVNDGSADHTEEVVLPYVKLDQRIRYIKKRNEGCLASARNHGLANAKGQYIAFLDDDDRWLPEKLEKQANHMELHPEIGFCYTQFQIYRLDGERLEPTKIFPEFLARTYKDLFNAFVPPSTVMIRKVCLDEVKGFKSKYRLSEDFDMWLRVGQRWKFAPIDEIHVYTVMDGRTHDGKDPLKVNEATINILRNLELIPECLSYKAYVRLQIARRIYQTGRIYLDEGEYGKAAQYFLRALLTDPLVGLAVRRPRDRGIRLIFRVLKAYLAIPACLVKGLIYAKR